MTQDKPLDLPTLLGALCKHYRRPDGQPCNSLVDVESTAQFQTNYNKALKRADGNATAARTKALVDMKSVREELSSLPVHVLEPSAINMVGKGKDAKSEEDGSGQVIVGTRVVLPDGRDRFLKSVPTAVRDSLGPADPAVLHGSITRTRDLITGRTSLRISRDASLAAEAHSEPFPRIGLDWQVGANARKEWKGAFYLDKKNNTIRGEFGKVWASDDPMFATVTLSGCGWVQDSGDVAAFCEDGAGNKGMVMLTKDWIAENLKVPESDDRDAYSDAFRDSGIELLVCGKGDVRRKLFPKAFGGPEKLAAEVADLRQQGLLVKADKGDREFLRIPSAHADEMTTKGIIPHVMVGDQKVVGLDVKGDWTDVFAMPDEPSFTLECIQSVRDKKAGGQWTKNEGFFAVPLGTVDGGPIRFSDEDPIYAQLKALESTAPSPASSTQAPLTGTESYRLHN